MVRLRFRSHTVTILIAAVVTATVTVTATAMAMAMAIATVIAIEQGQPAGIGYRRRETVLLRGHRDPRGTDFRRFRRRKRQKDAARRGERGSCGRGSQKGNLKIALNNKKCKKILCKMSKQGRETGSGKPLCQGNEGCSTSEGAFYSKKRRKDVWESSGTTAWRKVLGNSRERLRGERCLAIVGNGCMTQSCLEVAGNGCMAQRCLGIVRNGCMAKGAWQSSGTAAW